MNTKPLDKQAVQAKHYGVTPEESPEVVEDVIFDKAERVETQQKLTDGLDEKKESLKTIQQQLPTTEEGSIRDELLAQEEALIKEIQTLEATVEEIDDTVES